MVHRKLVVVVAVEQAPAEFFRAARRVARLVEAAVGQEVKQSALLGPAALQTGEVHASHGAAGRGPVSGGAAGRTAGRSTQAFTYYYMLLITCQFSSFIFACV